MFPDYDPIVGRQHLAELDPAVFDPTSGKIVITYQTFVVRTPKHTILIDTCTGEDKGYAAPMNFPKQPWLDNFRAGGLRFESIDYVFCTHLHSDHTGWNTMLRDVGAGYRHFQMQNTSSTSENTPTGKPRPGGGRFRPARYWSGAPRMCGPLIACRLWKLAKRCWSTTPLSWTTRSH